MNAIVETDALTKRYRPFTALVDCTLSVNSGEVFGLLGPNGAGKTTLLRLLLGFLRPTSGSASIAGLNCHDQSADVHKLVSYLPGDARLFRTMRGRQVLKFFSEIREDSDLERSQQIAERLELDLSRWVGFMSTGMRQKLALAVVMSVGARLLVLDEPTSNLDPNVRSEIMKMVLEAKQNGQTVILSSHVLSEVEETCDRVGILRAGHLVHTQCMNQLNRQHRITALTRRELPEIPQGLQDHLSIVRLDEGRVQIETPGELSMILHWLANAQLDDVYVEPVGLRSIYDQFHHDQSRSNHEECVTP